MKPSLQMEVLPQMDAILLEKIKQDTYEYLREQEAAITDRNIIQAMFMSEWLDADDWKPTCAFECSWWGRLLWWLSGIYPWYF